MFVFPQENTSLRKVDLSWNGFHIDGSEAVGKALQHNTTLQELSLATNRIDLESLSNLISGLKHNNTIKKLDVSQYLMVVGKLERFKM